jgi:hypothetical protein
MPRELGLEEKPVSFTESPNSTEESEEQDTNGRFILIRDHGEQDSRHPDTGGGVGKLHPYTSLLTISDLDSCVTLENAAFPIERERASREKVSSTVLYFRSLRI